MLRLNLKEQINPRGIKKDPWSFHSSGLGFGRAELQHNSNQKTAMGKPLWQLSMGNTYGKQLFVLLFLLPAALVGHWQLFLIGFGKGFSLVGVGGTGQQRWLKYSALQWSSPGQILGRIWPGCSQTSSTARHRKSCRYPEQSMPDCKKDKNKAAKPPLRPSFS